jgi:hypothetical protein
MLPADRVGSNPAQTDVTVGKTLSVYLRKVGGLSANTCTLYNVYRFFLLLIKIDRHNITEKLLSMSKITIKQTGTTKCIKLRLLLWFCNVVVRDVVCKIFDKI